MTNWIDVDDWLPGELQTVLIFIEYDSRPLGGYDFMSAIMVGCLRFDDNEENLEWYLETPDTWITLDDDEVMPYKKIKDLGYTVTHWTLLPSEPPNQFKNRNKR
jgi:hypothetical protein